MKEIISAVLLIASLYAGTQALKGFHDFIQRAALEKAANGLPSLTEMTRALQKKESPARKTPSGG